MVRDASADYPEWSALQQSIDSYGPRKKRLLRHGNLSDVYFGRTCPQTSRPRFRLPERVVLIVKRR